MTRGRKRLATFAVLVLTTQLLTTITPQPRANALLNRFRHSVIELGPILDLLAPSEPSEPTQPPKNPPPSPPATPPPFADANPMDLKVLVLATDGTEFDLAAIKQALEFVGVPYDLKLMAPLPGDPSTNRLGPILSDGGNHAFYQGIILTEGNLVYTPDGGGTYLSALTQPEWSSLWAYQAKFMVRAVSWYTYPNAQYGYEPPDGTLPFTAVKPVPYTSEGKSVFGSYANTATPVTIKNAYIYLAKPLTDGATTPLLADSEGHALAAVRKSADGRETLSLTFDSAAYLFHNLVLSYGLVNWVTKGIFVGMRHVYFGAQIDDLYIDNQTWPVSTPCGTNVEDPSLPIYRMTGADVRAFSAWQRNRQTSPTGKNLRVNFAFNAEGTTSDYYSAYKAGELGPLAVTPPQNDTLTAEVKKAQAQFGLINHTYTHANLDAISYGDATTELTKNDDYARATAFTNYKRQNMVQPDISGLTNNSFLTAARDFGILDLVSDTSRPTGDNPSPNAGRYNALQPSILEMPRHPVNLYFNASLKEEWLAEDNCIYPAGAFGHVDTYAQLLDRESDALVSYMLKGDMDPVMFHQANLRAYDGTNSVFTDLLTRMLQKYESYFTLPVLSPGMEELARRMINRMTFNGAGVKASMVPGPGGPKQLTITAAKDIVVPITGLNASGAEQYGGQYIAQVPVKAGQAVTLSPNASLTPASATFGKQQTNVASGAQTATLKNTGSLDLGITGITMTGTNPSDFAQSSNCPTMLASGASCTITSTFSPTAVGPRSGTMAVGTNSPSGPSSVALSGTGMKVGLTPQSLDFGTQLLGSPSGWRTVTLTDSGGAPLIVRSASLGGANPGDFNVTNRCSPTPYTLSVGSSCQIEVRFNPKLLSLGSRTATLVIDHDVGGAPRTVALSGTAI